MSMAFEITTDDVDIVIDRHNLEIPMGADIESLFDELNTDVIEHEALRGNSMDEQTNFAHNEILKQLEKIIKEAKNV